MAAAGLIGLILCSLSLQAASVQRFPSAAVALTLPGGWQDPTDPETLAVLPNAAAVKQWELAHFDVAFGADFGDPALNRKITAQTYMYNQIISFNPDALAMFLRQEAVKRGLAWESFFLHFTADTDFTIAASHVSDSTRTPFYGRAWIVGYTDNPSHSGYWLWDMPLVRALGVVVERCCCCCCCCCCCKLVRENVGRWSPPVTLHARLHARLCVCVCAVQTTPKRPFQHCGNGGAVHVYLSEKFDSVEFVLPSAQPGDGHIVVEYPNAVTTSAHGVQRFVASWAAIPGVVDGTSGMTTSGSVRWVPPADWALAATSDGSGLSWGGYQFFANDLLKKGGLAYVVRIRWVGTTPAGGPEVTDIHLRRWIVNVNGVSTHLRVPGWDPANDQNSDGYVDDAEFATLVNPQATARFLYEARAVPVGEMWSPSSCYCSINVWNANLVELIAEYMAQSWAAAGVAGAYNDDLLKLAGPNLYHVTSGGYVAESPNPAFPMQSEDMNLLFQGAFATLLKRIAAVSHSKWVSGNVSGVNMLRGAGNRALLDALGALLREDYLHPTLGLNGYFGCTLPHHGPSVLRAHLNRVTCAIRVLAVQRAWDTFGLAYLKKYSMIQGQIMNSRAAWYGKLDATNWQRDIESIVAQYYLMNVPGLTSLNVRAAVRRGASAGVLFGPRPAAVVFVEGRRAQFGVFATMRLVTELWGCVHLRGAMRRSGATVTTTARRAAARDGTGTSLASP